MHPVHDTTTIPALGIWNRQEVLKALADLEADVATQQELQNIFYGPSPFDAPDFVVADYVNEKFPDEKSLCVIDKVLEEIHSEISSLDEKISQTVREQSLSIEVVDQDLDALKTSSADIVTQLIAIQGRSKLAQAHVNEVCEDIRALDCAKSNLTATITSLKRLVMLITALDKLRAAAAERVYENAANLLLAASQLTASFEKFRALPRIADLLSQYETIVRELKSQIIEDFETLFDPDSEVAPNLLGACNVADAIDTRRDVITRFTSHFLEPYRQAFPSSSLFTSSALESLDRRFIWLKRAIRKFPTKYGQYFPISWDVLCIASERFCLVLREQLIDILGSANASATTLAQTLRKTREFEDFLISTFQDTAPVIGTTAHMTQMIQCIENRDKANFVFSEAVSQLQYSNVLKADIEAAELETKQEKDIASSLNIPTVSTVKFRGLLSTCFSSYMGPWLREEEKRLLGAMPQNTEDGIIANDTEDGDYENVPRVVYSSAIDILAAVKSSYQRVSAVSSGQTLVDMFKIFKRVLLKYCSILKSRLPIKIDYGERRMFETVCAVLGTADYVTSTLPHITEAVIRVIDSQLSSCVEFDAENDAFGELKSQTIKILNESLKGDIKKQLLIMSSYKWKDIVDVGDESIWTHQILDVFETFLTTASELLNPPSYRLLCDEFAGWFVIAYKNAIYACSYLSETAAQQLLLDTNALKARLLETPLAVGGGIKPTAIYSKVLLRELGRCESLLKILTSSTRSKEALIKFLVEDAGITDEEELKRIVQLRACDVNNAQQQPSIQKQIDVTDRL